MLKEGKNEKVEKKKMGKQEKKQTSIMKGNY
jgi:hypothetical protein